MGLFGKKKIKEIIRPQSSVSTNTSSRASVPPKSNYSSSTLPSKNSIDIKIDSVEKTKSPTPPPKNDNTSRNPFISKSPSPNPPTPVSNQQQQQHEKRNPFLSKANGQAPKVNVEPPKINVEPPKENGQAPKENNNETPKPKHNPFIRPTSTINETKEEKKNDSTINSSTNKQETSHTSAFNRLPVDYKKDGRIIDFSKIKRNPIFDFIIDPQIQENQESITNIEPVKKINKIQAKDIYDAINHARTNKIKDSTKFNYNQYKKCCILYIDQFNKLSIAIRNNSALKEHDFLSVYDARVNYYEKDGSLRHWDVLKFEFPETNRAKGIYFENDVLGSLLQAYLEEDYGNMKLKAISNHFKFVIEEAHKKSGDNNPLDTNYVFILPEDYHVEINKDVIDTIVRPLFLVSGIIKETDHKDRLQFMSVFNATFGFLQSFEDELDTQIESIRPSFFVKDKNIMYCTLAQDGLSGINMYQLRVKEDSNEPNSTNPYFTIDSVDIAKIYQNVSWIQDREIIQVIQKWVDKNFDLKKLANLESESDREVFFEFIHKLVKLHVTGKNQNIKNLAYSNTNLSQENLKLIKSRDFLNRVYKNIIREHYKEICQLIESIRDECAKHDAAIVVDFKQHSHHNDGFLYHYAIKKSAEYYDGKSKIDIIDADLFLGDPTVEETNQIIDGAFMKMANMIKQQ